MLDIKTLENWLWEAACKIRGPVDAPKYKDYILPLVFLKRLSDVFDEEIEKLAQEYDDKKTAEDLVEEDHSLVWFYIPKNARWEAVFKQSTRLGEFLTDAVRAIARENPKLQGVIDTKDFNESSGGHRIVSDELLKSLIDVLNKHKLGLKDAEPDILGRAWEYLLRKFAEGSGKSAGEFYTPKEVAILMAKIVDPKEGESVYDPCLGSGGLIIKTFLRFKEKYGNDSKIKPLQFYGQEDSPDTYAMARMNSFIHRMEAEIARGDSMNRPAFKKEDGGLKQFDIVVANPMWNQNIFTKATYENDVFNRFVYGYPPNSSADWGWVQHMFKSLTKHGRMAIVLDSGALYRGSGKENKQKAEYSIRKKFIEEDYVEAVIALPSNLFYNTTSPGCIIILNKNKGESRKNKILFIYAEKGFLKLKNANRLRDEDINKSFDSYHNFHEIDKFSKVVKFEEIKKNDYDLTVSWYVDYFDDEKLIDINSIWTKLESYEEKRLKINKNIQGYLEKLK
tara:strand:+ start:281 stop:1801 length:1521 start_codon:yes stop_codon:yes gene_type:complete